jgi:hypothetical protein
MSDDLQSPLQKLVDKLRNSRDFTISLLIHIILVAAFGGTVLFQAVQEPPDFEGEGGGFVGAGEETNAPPQPTQVMPQTQDITVTSTPVNTSAVNAITTTAASSMNFNMAQMVMAPPAPAAPTTQMSAPKTMAPAGGMSGGMSGADASAIKAFTTGWGKGSGSGTGTRSREFEFTAYIGKYDGGNWNSTVTSVGNDPKKLNNGSLPNLLAYMSTRSKNKVKTNYDKVEAIKLDSPDLFKIKPPFIFITGTKDFRLTEAEVENLRKYVRVGGAIWGDSSVPGRNSRFDIAFRREMRRVIPDKNKDWEELPKNHPIFDQRQAYFPEIKEVPPGLNFYREPVYVLRIYGTEAQPGEVAIIYTANDYGDMWQIGLLPDGNVDLRRNEKNQYVAIRQEIWENRDTYIRNITPQSLNTAYMFGTNLVMHLLTRWDSKVKSAPSL